MDERKKDQKVYPRTFGIIEEVKKKQYPKDRKCQSLLRGKVALRETLKSKGKKSGIERSI